MACEYNYNGKWMTKEQLLALPEFNPKEMLDHTMQREYMINNTGIKSDEQINLFSPEEAETGVFTKFINFKKAQIYNSEKRLNTIERLKRKRDITTDDLTKLNKLEREIKLQVEGNFELGIKGLRQEIAELEKNANVEAIGFYVEKDINRLAKLSNSDSIDDLNEAQRLIDFYDLAGTFRRNVENPFFTQEEMFLNDEGGNLTSEYRLSDDTMKQYREWRDRTLSYQNIIDKRREEVTVNTVNTDGSVKRTYGDRKFTFDELINDETGLKDVDWVSMWTMDITNGIFSNNGILPQVMFSYLANSMEKKLSWAREIEEKIDKMNSGVQKELVKLGHSLEGVGIIGLTGATYNIFKEITKEGNETGGLIQRYVKEFYDANSANLNKFYRSFNESKLFQDYNARTQAFNKAFEELKRWRRNNTIIMDIANIPELVNNPDFKQLFTGKTTLTSEDHSKYLKSILGEKGYKEEIAKQERLLRKFQSEKQATIETLLTLENKATEAELSDKAKTDLSHWENNHSPFRGVDDFNSIQGIFSGERKTNSFMDFNSFIPRKFVPAITVDGDSYKFTDTTKETGHYNSTFQQIENNEVLSDFYDVMKEVCETIREVMPYELQQKMPVNTIPALQKTSTEIVADKNTGILSSLFLAFKNLIEKIKLSFGVTKQSEISYAVVDPVTGKSNYKVNDEFFQGKTRAISERETIERSKFKQAYNSGNKDAKLVSIGRFTTLPLKEMDANSLLLLAQYLHIDLSVADAKAGRIQAIRDRTGDHVEIGKFIRDFSIHSVVQSQSFDLAKIGKYFSNMAMMYAARTEALPILEIMKNHYEAIQKPKTNNLGNGIYNANDESYMKTGVRTNAIKQMDDWFERVGLGNYETKHLGPHGQTAKSAKALAKIDQRIKEIDQSLANSSIPQAQKEKLISEKERLQIKKNIPGYSATIYSMEDKRKLAEIENLLQNTKDEKERTKLLKIKENLGKARTATALFDNMLGFIRTLRLGFNISSATTNFMEGVMSNMILGAQNEFFDPKEMFYGYSVIKHSFLKNITFGIAETGLAKRNRSLMDKFNVIMDSKNELQKSSVRTYASKFSWLNPHELNSRVEYINQSPVMIALLRTEKIKAKDGKESSVWEAMQNNGHLKEEFQTEENQKNWEDLQGEQYLNFKQKLHKVIVLGHGNYDELRGMMIKNNSAGKALAMFKTWLPMQLYWRFATEQDDIQSGTIGYKGRYWSYGKGTGALHGAAVGAAVFGPIGAAVGGGVGYFFGSQFGTDSGVGVLKETVESTKQLLKKVIGMPVNLLAGRQIIGSGSKAFEAWVGKGDFSQQDARNMRGNMADLSMQLAFLGLILLVKGLFWDDDDKPDDPERIAHNILVNKLMNLSSQAASYVSPPDAFKNTISSNALIQYLTDIGKEVDKVHAYLNGNDIILSGPNAGKSGLASQTKKILLPGLFKDRMLGFESQAEKVIQESPYHEYFKGAAKKDKEANQRDRAARKLDLEDDDQFKDMDEKEKTKAIRKILDKELPTPTKLKKLHKTRKEYEAELDETQ